MQGKRDDTSVVGAVLSRASVFMILLFYVYDFYKQEVGPLHKDHKETLKTIKNINSCELSVRPIISRSRPPYFPPYLPPYFCLSPQNMAKKNMEANMAKNLRPKVPR